MGIVERLRRLAFARPTAFVVVGGGGDEVWQRLLRTGAVRPSPAPHDSDVLVLAGAIPNAWTRPLQALFETIALPRLVVWLRPQHDAPAPAGLPLVELDPDRPDRDALRRQLLDPQAPANRPLLEDQPPSPWRGQGDHGQGGEAMMGGKPYGRPMAMVGDDPDGLMLGELPTSLGPFFPGLPSGLQVRLSLQGDRIKSVREVINWYPERQVDDADAIPDLRLTLDALRGREVAAGALERARIRSHLRAAAMLLDLEGLGALARRFRLQAETTDPRALARLFGAVRLRGLRRVLAGVGRIGREQAEQMGLRGPVARASGIGRDARCSDRAYRGAGFEVVTESAGDAWARFEVRRRECLQSAALIEQLGAATTRVAEGPRGLFDREQPVLAPSHANLAALEQVIPGLLWPEAVLAVASLDLDMAEAALR